MARYIDADAMCADLETVNPDYKYMVDWAIREIKAQPTVDAVEVVRCKDCECWGLNRTWLKDGEVYMQDCFVNEMMTKPDFFCASGEKKKQASEQKTGTWWYREVLNYRGDFKIWMYQLKCSECKAMFTFYEREHAKEYARATKECPYCKAKMEFKESEE